MSPKMVAWVEPCVDKICQMVDEKWDKFSKADKKILGDCRGHCEICMYDGGCAIQKRLRSMGC